MAHLDSVIIGAGQAGLGASYYLQKDGVKHVALERGRVGETWLSQRWDSFQVNTPNFINVLPGLAYQGREPDGFWRSEELVSYFGDYCQHFKLPVQTGQEVISVERDKENKIFLVRTKTDNLESRSVVIASGILQKPKIPALSSRIPAEIKQLHVAEYRRAEILPPGGIVIIGSAQSGCQIAEDLVAAGRKVFLCTSKVGRIPRRYRGRDLLDWWVEMKVFDSPLNGLEDKSILRMPQPQVSGLGRWGHSVSLQWLAYQGVTILGRALNFKDGKFILSNEAAGHVRHADEFSQMAKKSIDEYIRSNNLQAQPAEEDPGDIADPQAKCVTPWRELDLHNEKISTVLWATGFTADFSWMHLPVHDKNGMPVHNNGVSLVPGLYFIGFPWLSSRKSGIIYGINEDARFISGALERHLQSGTAH